MTLERFFQEHPRCALAFSGGVDSAYLLWAGIQAGAEIRPYFVKTPFQPGSELEDARRLCRQLGARLEVIGFDILTDGTVAANPADRCYHCKRRLFSLIKERAEAEGFPLLLDGTNASDDAGDRPGMRALRELEVRSPLREHGLTKQAVREESRRAGLSTWDKPSYACLATRIPTGRAIVREDLEKVERGEELLSGMGFRDFRLRLTESGCKLQVTDGQLPLVLARRTDILTALEPLFGEAVLDLRGRAVQDQRDHTDGRHDILQLLRQVAEGSASPEEALSQLKREPFEDLGYAKVDLHRGIRQGAAEVIYGAGKSPEQIARIAAAMGARGHKNILITRLSPEAAAVVERTVPLDYRPIPRLAIAHPGERDARGHIVVATGGTSDMPVAEEAALTAEALGNRVTRLYDVGVAGLHRLLSNLDPLMEARCVVAVAGMEGALASVIGGLVDCPVIAVPTSVGYGASFGGLSALLAMLNSCASGCSVVNIDNGFGAGYLASMINQMEGIE